MKPLLLRLALVIGAACLLPSCEVYDTYPGGGYVSAGYDYYPDGGYYDDYDDGFYDYVPRYTAYDYWGPSHSYYFGGRYYSHAWWHDDDYTRYRRARDVHRARHHRSNHSSSHRGEPLKLVRYRENDGRRLPGGYHSAQWYKDRGFSLKQNTYRDREGDVHGRQSTSRDRDDNRRSSANRSSSSTSHRSVASQSGADRNVSRYRPPQREVASRSSASRPSANHTVSKSGNAHRGSDPRSSGNSSRYSQPSGSGGSSSKERSASKGSDDRKKK